MTSAIDRNAVPRKPARAPGAGSSSVDAIGSAVRLWNVSKRFGRIIAVDDLTLSLPAGTTYGLIGANGAGKTTTFSMLAGFVRPSEGTLEILGHRPGDLRALRGRVGVLPQDALLPNTDTVGEFLVHAARLQGIPAHQAEASARFVLEEVAGGDWWARGCVSLSHGMAKRVGLAQAFLGEPELILLDEPTAGLDPRAAWEIRELVRAKRGRATVVVSSHNLQEVEDVCDGAVIIDRGRVVASGSMTDLTAANEEICIRVAPGTVRGVQRGQVPVQMLRDVVGVQSAELDEERSEIVVFFDRARAEAEDVIAATLRLLLDHDVRISGLTKGRGLEQRVMDVVRPS